MNQPINDGGPAFPHTTQWDGITPAINHNGMTLRDYFAAAALEKASRGSDRNADEIAKRAFYIADAMLRAREAKP
jgi:hypothetical protein